MASLLQSAIRQGQRERVVALLAAGADVNAADPEGRTALSVAAEAGQAQVEKLLLAAGADTNAADGAGRRPLYCAALRGHDKVVQLLLASGAHVNDHVPGKGPLRAAVQAGRYEVVQLLLAAGCDADARDSRGWTPLMTAAEHGHYKVAQLLLRRGANPQLRIRAHNLTALDLAAQRGQPSMVRLLLEAWGLPQITAAELLRAARIALLLAFWDAGRPQSMASLAQLAKALRQLYPSKLPELFDGEVCPDAPDALAAALEAWAADVSSLDEQQAAVRAREEGVASETAKMQQLIVAIAGMARHTEEEVPDQVQAQAQAVCSVAGLSMLGE